jgi:hypothetical protein
MLDAVAKSKGSHYPGFVVGIVYSMRHVDSQDTGSIQAESVDFFNIRVSMTPTVVSGIVDITLIRVEYLIKQGK